jgi:hypothetical protein
VSYGTPENVSNKYEVRFTSNATPGIEAWLTIEKTFDFTEAQYDAAFQDILNKVDPISGWTLSGATKIETNSQTVTPA